MSEPTRLLFFAGSSRTGSHNMKVAELGARIAEANGIASTLADLGDYAMPLYNGDIERTEGPPENARKLKALLSLHTGVLISCPEYNASISPLLKNTLDWISRVREEDEAPNEVFRTRVFALASASPGGMGGLRGLYAVRHVLELGLGALVLPEQFAVPRAANAFEENGHLKDVAAQERFKDLIGKLARAARVLHG